MGTALIYLVVLLGVAAVFFAGASVVFGRGEELAPVPRGATPTWLPDREVHASHVRQVRFQQAVRGYKMAEVDWVLDRLAGELDRHTTESDSLRRRIAELESAVAGAKQADVAHLVTGAAQTQPRGNGTMHAPDAAPVHGEPAHPSREPVQRDSGGRVPEEAGPDRRVADKPATGERPDGDRSAAAPHVPTAPIHGRPGEASAREGRSGEGRPGEASPGEGRPGEAPPGEARSGGAPAREARPGEASPGEARPSEASAREARSGEAPPGEARAGTTRDRQRGAEEPG